MESGTYNYFFYEPSLFDFMESLLSSYIILTDRFFSYFRHVPPFVALSAIKNEYMKCDASTPDICETWFNFDLNGCNILPSVYDELIYKYFGVENRIEFQPPILIGGKPSSTYYKLEYINEGDACADGNCRGPHYCSKEAADADIW